MEGLVAIVIRSVSVYLFMLVAIRLTGKKELSQLNTADVVLILLISNAVQNAMVGTDTSLQGGLLAAAVLFLLNYVLKLLLFKYPGFRNLLNEKPEVLIHHGKLDFENLNKLKITQEELEEAMREHGVDHFRDVRLAMLEVDGTLSIISGDSHMRQTVFKRKYPQKSRSFR